ncbi:hypothetical protein NQ317_017244 [Molorchus minor]|uniref:Uncharacterized protein n=1 Tax=Molorchus minor TaxID=1323400 RepID=A0ABQ9J2B5_9CUCU|nr:hypothetical protein NQ317_017244 [Molorchus minor]
MKLCNEKLLEDLKEKADMIRKLEETNTQLEEITNENKDIFEIVDNLSQEKSGLAQTLDVVNKELEKVSKEKCDLTYSLEISNNELQKVKRERNEILKTQTKIMKETENNILLAHENAVEIKNDLLRRIEVVEKEKQSLKKQLETDLHKVREAYANVVSTNSKFELENNNLRKKVEEKNKQLLESLQIKEAYERLIEENNKLIMEVDTAKYRRSRDREEFINLLKKEREEADMRGKQKNTRH